MNFGMFTDFHVRADMSQAEAFEESFQSGGGGRANGYGLGLACRAPFHSRPVGAGLTIDHSQRYCRAYLDPPRGAGRAGIAPDQSTESGGGGGHRGPHQQGALRFWHWTQRPHQVLPRVQHSLFRKPRTVFRSPPGNYEGVERWQFLSPRRLLLLRTMCRWSLSPSSNPTRRHASP